MKQLLITTFLFLFSVLNIFGQENPDFMQGRVSFISSQNFYTKFESTESISSGDTLFILSNNRFIPAIKVNNVSSMSCVGIGIDSIKLNVNDLVFARKKVIEDPIPLNVIKKDTIVVKDTAALINKVYDAPKSKPKQIINGRIGVASYSNFSNLGNSDFSKMRYTLSLSGKNILVTGMSLDCYVSFNHSKNSWSEIKDNIYNGLKIYDLSVKYDLSKSTRISLGRKINPNISNLGAMDGIQFETGLKSFTFGALAGFSPDHFDYSFNFNLFQYGGYLGNQLKNKNGTAQSTIAFFEQKNNAITDRRYLYFQHANSMVKNIYAFISLETDLYTVIDSIPQSTFDLTGLYFSLNYRPFSKLSLSASFDQRKNVVYYETFKSYLDYLIDNESRKGYGFSLNYRISKSVRYGLRTTYRFKASDPVSSRNLYTYFLFSKVPWIKASANLTANFLETSYLKGMIYGISLSKDFLSDKMNIQLRYRYFDGLYSLSDVKIIQNIAELSLSYELIKRITFSLDYELTQENKGIYNRVYLSLIKRF